MKQRFRNFLQAIGTLFGTVERRQIINCQLPSRHRIHTERAENRYARETKKKTYASSYCRILQFSCQSGAEPSATFFQILMHGESEEMLDGTQLAADWTFSGLQKFGQAFIDRLRGKRLPNQLLEKVNIVEVPGILEVRKQVDRPYPFNDVVQWFIDRADIIFVVYDPTKLDTGLEHEALFDQLKGRQNQVNKAQ